MLIFEVGGDIQNRAGDLSCCLLVKLTCCFYINVAGDIPQNESDVYEINQNAGENPRPLAVNDSPAIL